MEIKEVKLVNNDLAPLESLKIGHEEDGTVYVENFELVRDTLESLLEGKDKIIVTTEENSVKSAQDASTKLNSAKKAVSQIFINEEQRLKTELAKLTEPRKELQHLFDASLDNLKVEVLGAKEKWKLQAIEEQQRDCSVDLTPEMFAKIKPTMRMSKKKIIDDVMLRIQEIEDEFAQKQKDEETLEKLCELQNLDFMMYKVLLETKTLADVMDIIAKQQEEKRLREEAIAAEERRRKQQEEQAAQEERARQTIVNEVVPTLQDVTPDELEPELDPFVFEKPEEPLMRWIVEITTTPSKQQLLSNFCKQHGIDVIVPDGIASNY